jgi:hypothetical protein
VLNSAFSASWRARGSGGNETSRREVGAGGAREVLHRHGP